MAKCPRCSSRKGKRHCPALRTSICPACCADERLKTIACPQDCVHLRGELYQHRRRQERARSLGKEFVDANKKIFPSRESHDFAFNLQADIYYFSRKHGPVSDEAIAGALESLRSYCSRIFVPEGAPHPILPFLIERIRDARRYPVGPGFTVEAQMRALGSLASYIRSLARSATASPARPGAKGGDTTRHFESLSSFFDSLDFEADLDYSPEDPQAAAAQEEAVVRRSPGGLILPS